jgi:hypothetical protein
VYGDHDDSRAQENDIPNTPQSQRAMDKKRGSLGAGGSLNSLNSNNSNSIKNTIFQRPSNKQRIINALKQVCLAGPNEKERNEVFEKVIDSKSENFIVLFKGLITGRMANIFLII